MKANAAEGDVITTFDSNTVVSGSGYQEYSNDSWIVTCGGNNKSVGSNSKSANKLTLTEDYASIGKNISLSSKTAAVISKEPIANVGKIILSRDAVNTSGSDDDTSYYVVSSTSKYDTSSADYQIVASGIFIEGVDISIDIDDSESKYYSIVFTADGWFRLDNVVASFREGPDQSTKYNVNFYDGDSLIFTEAVNDGDSVDFSLVDTEKEGYIFKGWYEDPEFNIAYDEDAPVTSDLNLYAHYIAHEDLTSGEIFASETTKTSLVASTNKKQSILKNTINYANFGENFIFNGESKLSSLGFDEKWTYESKDNGSNYYPTIYASDDTLRFYKNGTFVKFNYMGIIHSIAFSNTTGLDNFTISGDDGIEVKGDNGKYTFENGTSSIKILNNANDTIKLYGNFSIEYEDMITVPTNASIRFGATLDSKIYDETAKYGVVFGLAGEDLNTLAEGKKTIDELALPYREVDHGTLAKVDEEGALEESDTPETAPFFQYAIVVNNMLAHIDEEITAACYMQTTEGLYVMNEVTYSLRSLAQKYIDDHVVDESIDVLNAIVGYQA